MSMCLHFSPPHKRFSINFQAIVLFQHIFSISTCLILFYQCHCCFSLQFSWCKISLPPMKINEVHARKRWGRRPINSIFTNFMANIFDAIFIVKQSLKCNIPMNCLWGASANTYLRAENPICDGNNFMIQSQSFFFCHHHPTLFLRLSLLHLSLSDSLYLSSVIRRVFISFHAQCGSIALLSIFI